MSHDDYCGMLPKEQTDLTMVPYGSRIRPYKCCNCINPPQKAKRRSRRIPPTAQRHDSFYLQHLHRVCTMRKVIDNNPPHVSINQLTKTDVMKKNLLRFEQINKENKTLLCQIDLIRRSKGIVDSYNPNAGLRTSNLHVMHIQAMRLEKENRQMYQRIMSVEPIIKNSDLLKDWKRNRSAIEDACRFPPILPGICPSSTNLISSDCMDQYRPKAFLDISVRDGRKLGRVIILLYPDIVPITTRNFMELVHNYKREKKTRRRGIKTQFTHYVGSSIYKIYKNLYIEMGDVTKQNGIGGRSATGQDFEEENFILEAEHPGMLAMIPDEDGMVNSKFLMTLKPLKVLNGRRVMFGRIIKGLDLVDIIEKSSRPNGQPKEPIIISNCGLLPPRRLVKDQTSFVNM